MNSFFAKSLWWITLVIAIFLLVAHILSFKSLNIDSVTIGLIIVIFLSPFISSIKKIKFGDIEAEIDPKEVRKVKDNVEAQLAATTIKGKNLSLISQNNIIDLVDSDAVLALAKLRIELEKAIVRLHDSLDIKKGKQRNSLTKMVTDLMRKELLSRETYSSLREIISICNRAVHGEEIRSGDAKTIVEAGIDLLEILSQIYPEIIADVNLEKIFVKKDEVEGYEGAKYKLTTIVPLVDEPYKLVRVLNQESLDKFFEAYNEFAEFIIDLRKIEE